MNGSGASRKFRYFAVRATPTISINPRSESTLHTLAQRIAIKISARKFLVYDSHLRTTPPVFWTEGTATHDGNVHRSEVVWFNDVRVELHLFIRLWLITFNFGVTSMAATGNRHIGTQRGATHAGHVPDALEHLLVERLSLFSIEPRSACVE